MKNQAQWESLLKKTPSNRFFAQTFNIFVAEWVARNIKKYSILNSEISLWVSRHGLTIPTHLGDPSVPRASKLEPKPRFEWVIRVIRIPNFQTNPNDFKSNFLPYVPFIYINLQA